MAVSKTWEFEVYKKDLAYQGGPEFHWNIWKIRQGIVDGKCAQNRMTH